MNPAEPEGLSVNASTIFFEGNPALSKPIQALDDPSLAFEQILQDLDTKTAGA
jgi:hypothetical protein